MANVIIFIPSNRRSIISNANKDIINPSNRYCSITYAYVTPIILSYLDIIIIKTYKIYNNNIY